MRVVAINDTRKAADALLENGLGTALITLGEQGALLQNVDQSVHIPAMKACKLIKATGAFSVVTECLLRFGNSVHW
jgi:ribokinase